MSNIEYVVLRKCALNFDARARGAFLSSPPCLNNKYYAGIDRMPWFDLDEKYYSGALSKEVREELEKIHRNISNYGLPVSNELNLATMLLELSNQDSDANELVFLCKRGEKLPSISGFELSDLGVDLYVDGYGSIIRNGFFSHNDSELIKVYEQHLNPSGIFNNNDEGIIEQYVKAYKQSESVEPVEGAVHRISILKMNKQ